MKTNSVLRRLAMVLFYACLSSAVFAQTGLERAPRGVMIEFKVFEIPMDYHYTFEASLAKKKEGYRLVLLSDNALPERLAKETKESGVRALAAPKVRTLDGMQAMIAQSIRIGGDARARIQFEATPKVKSEEQVELEMSGRLSSGAEKEPGYKLFWSSQDKVEVKSGLPILMEFAVKDSDGAEHKFLVIVNVEVMPLGG